MFLARTAEPGQGHGQGDILDEAPGGQQTGAVAYARLIAYAEAAVVAGFDAFLVVTCPTIGPDVLGTGRPTVSEAAALAEYNALIVSELDPLLVVRCDTAPFDDATNTTYFDVDRTHITEAGSALAAERIRASLLALLATFSL